MSRTNKVLKSTGWGNPDTAGIASDTNHLEHTTARTARRTFLVYQIHATARAHSNPDAFSGWVNLRVRSSPSILSDLGNVLDHHCPWVNNCLGQYNYGHFIRFLFYVDATCSYHVFMITYRALSSVKNGFWVIPIISDETPTS